MSATGRLVRTPGHHLELGVGELARRQRHSNLLQGDVEPVLGGDSLDVKRSTGLGDHGGEC